MQDKLDSEPNIFLKTGSQLAIDVYPPEEIKEILQIDTLLKENIDYINGSYMKKYIENIKDYDNDIGLWLR